MSAPVVFEAAKWGHWLRQQAASALRRRIATLRIPANAAAALHDAGAPPVVLQGRLSIEDAEAIADLLDPRQELAQLPAAPEAVEVGRP